MLGLTHRQIPCGSRQYVRDLLLKYFRNTEMIFFSLTFMMDSMMNLINEPHHKYESKKYHSLYTKNT